MQKYKDIFGFFNYESLYSEMVCKFPSGSIFVELGVYFGKSLCYLAEQAQKENKEIKIYGVDHWYNMYTPFEKTHRKIPDYIVENVKTWGDVYRIACENLKPFSDFLTLIKGDSATTSNQFKDGQVDFLFIDASHTYTEVRRDIKMWLPKMKSGGVLAGHDYSKDFPQVQVAVSRELKDKQFTVKNDIWRYDVP